MFVEINASHLASHRKSFPLASIPSIDEINQILSELGVSFRERIFTPLVTLYGFLSQVLGDDPSCRRAVVEINAMRHAHNLKACCFNTGSFSKAKMRLPLELICRLTKKMAALGEHAWRHGRVYVVDGSGISMADTPANQKHFPSHTKNAAGFPVGHIVALFSLASGSLVDLAAAPIKGKGNGELTLINRLWDKLKRGDTLLGDCLYSSFAVVATARSRGCHVVAEYRKKCCWRLRKKRLDQIIRIEKPRIKPDSLSREVFDSWPDYIDVRIVKLKCAPKGFRVKTKFILTTHLTADVTMSELLNLYKRRWQVELNLRSIKTVMGMDVLRSRSPEMVVKEIWVYMLAYNLIRFEMLKSAVEKKIPPEELSFRAAQQLVCAFRALSSCNAGGANLIWHTLSELIASQRVGQRPNRYEPRAIRRRKRNFHTLSLPRKIARGMLFKKRKVQAKA